MSKELRLKILLFFLNVVLFPLDFLGTKHPKLKLVFFWIGVAAFLACMAWTILGR